MIEIQKKSKENKNISKKIISKIANLPLEEAWDYFLVVAEDNNFNWNTLIEIANLAKKKEMESFFILSILFTFARRCTEIQLSFQAQGGKNIYFTPLIEVVQPFVIQIMKNHDDTALWILYRLYEEYPCIIEHLEMTKCGNA